MARMPDTLEITMPDGTVHTVGIRAVTGERPGPSSGRRTTVRPVTTAAPLSPPKP